MYTLIYASNVYSEPLQFNNIPFVGFDGAIECAKNTIKRVLDREGYLIQKIEVYTIKKVATITATDSTAESFDVIIKPRRSKDNK